MVWSMAPSWLALLGRNVAKELVAKELMATYTKCRFWMAL